MIRRRGCIRTRRWCLVLVGRIGGGAVGRGNGRWRVLGCRMGDAKVNVALLKLLQVPWVGESRAATIVVYRSPCGRMGTRYNRGGGEFTPLANIQFAADWSDLSNPGLRANQWGLYICWGCTFSCSTIVARLQFEWPLLSGGLRIPWKVLTISSSTVIPPR